jgi:hypothetical protein
MTGDPGAAVTTTLFAEDGGITPCAENRPRSEVTTPARNAVLVCVPEVTVTFTDGTPAGISNGTCTLTWVGLT